MKLSIIFTTLAVFLWQGCSTIAELGPKAQIAVIKKEVKKTKSLRNVIIANASGMNDKKASLAILATAMNTYGKKSRPAEAIKPIVSKVAPAELADVIMAAYQAEFVQAINKNGGKNLKKLKLPKPKKLGFKVPKGMKGAKVLGKKFMEEAKGIKTLAQAIATSDNKKLRKAMKQSQQVVNMVLRFNKFLFRKLGANYMLLTHVEGDEKDWTGGKEISMYAALVNVKTGRLRYFGTIKDKKGVVPTPFTAQIGLMANNLFSAVESNQKLPADGAEE
jgi:hypothetical protein